MDSLRDRIVRSLIRWLDMPESLKNVPTGGTPLTVDSVSDGGFTFHTTDSKGNFRRFVAKISEV
jgi:hypothetical protein